ncbi:MAG: hypothetical protein EOP84_26730, partial [Verrucomicrobiaceae bacterium]
MQSGVLWLPDGLASATSKSSIKFLNSDFNDSSVVRLPSDQGQPLQQVKTASTLGVISQADANSPLKWMVYDASNIAPKIPGMDVYPLTRLGGAALPLLEEVSVTKLGTDSLRLVTTRGGAVAEDHTMAFNPTSNSWTHENNRVPVRNIVTVSAVGSGWLTTRKRMEKDSLNVWRTVSWSAEERQVYGGREVVTREWLGGDEVRRADYHPDGRKKWILEDDGSWEFYEYLGNGTINTYSPFADNNQDG